MTQINDAIAAFTAEMKMLGMWNATVVLEASDFGRTFGTNGAGTDHAWGGHYFMLGGGLKGGQMLGEYRYCTYYTYYTYCYPYYPYYPCYTQHTYYTFHTFHTYHTSHTTHTYHAY
jgi:hypothetical protein